MVKKMLAALLALGIIGGVSAAENGDASPVRDGRDLKCAAAADAATDAGIAVSVVR